MHGAKVVYRRWTLLIPVLMAIIGFSLMFLSGYYGSAIGLVGGVIVFIAILTFGVLFTAMVGIEFAAQSMAKKTQSRSSFRERIEEKEQLSEEME